MKNNRTGKILYSIWLNKEETAIVDKMLEIKHFETAVETLTDNLKEAIKRGDLEKR